MARVNIEIPEKFIYKTQIKVRVSDLNYGNHLANDKVQAYLQEARLDFLSSFSLSELNIGENVSLIQGDAAIVYLSEGFLANKIEIELTVADFSNSSFDFYYALFNTQTQKKLAIAKTRMVCFNYENRKIEAVPQSFKELISSLLQTP